MAYSSTLPGALTTVLGYLTTVAGVVSLPEPVEVSFGWPVQEFLPNYFMIVGDYSSKGGLPFSNFLTDFTPLMPVGNYAKESYNINVSFSVASGASDPAAQLARITDAFTLFNAFCGLLADDPMGSGSLGGSGSWGTVISSAPEAGPFYDGAGNQTGWGVVMEAALRPINIRIPVR